MIALIVIFSWTRLILDPIGLRVLLVCLLALLIGSALHSALFEFRGDKITRNWKSAFSINPNGDA